MRLREEIGRRGSRILGFGVLGLGLRARAWNQDRQSLRRLESVCFPEGLGRGPGILVGGCWMLGEICVRVLIIESARLLQLP